MTPARSLAASVVALGFAGALTAPPPAYAAPAPCERAENYAAQSGAELLRINRLELRTTGSERPADKSGTSPSGDDHSDSVREDPVPGPDSSSGSTDLGDPPPAGAPGSGKAATDEASEDADSGGSGAGSVIGGVDDATKGDRRAVTGGGRIAAASPEARASRAGGDALVTGVGLGEARTGLVADAQVNSAAMARMVDGQAAGKAALTEPLVQQAPPSNDRGAVRRTPASRVGPITVGTGELDAHARWDARMACGNTAGEAASAAASLNRMDILGGAGGALVRVPEKISSRSTTGLERRGNDPWTVASATVAAGRLCLAGDRVRVRVLRAPTLTASIATGSSGEVRYRPAVIEVSGPGITTKRLETVGDVVEVSLGDDLPAPESTSLGALSALDGVRSGSPMPLPTVPGLPSLGAFDAESAPAPGPGTEVRISLGDVRQATRGNAIAARATAIKIAITQGSAGGRQSRQGYGGKARGSVVAEVGFGLLEAAVVAPESTPRTVAGTTGGLPITGPQAALLAMGGLGLLVTGGVAVFLSVRRRRSVQ